VDVMARKRRVRRIVALLREGDRAIDGRHAG